MKGHRCVTLFRRYSYVTLAANVHNTSGAFRDVLKFIILVGDMSQHCPANTSNSEKTSRRQNSTTI